MPPRRRFVRKLVTFGRILREAGLEVGPGRMQDALLGLAAVDLDQPRRRLLGAALHDRLAARRHRGLRRRLRGLLGAGPAHHAAAAAGRDRRRAARGRRAGRPGAGGRGRGHRPRDARRRGSATSRATQEDDETAARRSGRPTSSCATATSRATGPTSCAVPARSWRASRASPRGGARCAASRRSTGARSTRGARCSEAMRTGGVPIERAWREPKLVPRQLVFLVDVSGSMEPYARAMVMFLQAAVRAGRHVEAFTFGTRLTRLTPHLAGRDPDRALARRRARRARLGRRHAHRREPEGLQRRLGPARPDPRRDRRDRLRRLGARRSRAARRARWQRLHRAAHTRRLDQPAGRRRGLPAARRAAWQRRCRTSTTSCPGTTCARWRPWPRCWRRSTKASMPTRSRYAPSPAA